MLPKQAISTRPRMGGNGATLFNNLISHGKQKKDDVIYVDTEN